MIRNTNWQCSGASSGISIILMFLEDYFWHRALWNQDMHRIGRNQKNKDPHINFQGPSIRAIFCPKIIICPTAWNERRPMQQNIEVSWNIETDGDGTNTCISLDKNGMWTVGKASKPLRIWFINSRYLNHLMWGRPNGQWPVGILNNCSKPTIWTII